VLVEDRLHGCPSPYSSDRTAALLSWANNSTFNIGGLRDKGAIPRSNCLLSATRAGDSSRHLGHGQTVLCLLQGVPSLCSSTANIRHGHPIIRARTRSVCCHLLCVAALPPNVVCADPLRGVEIGVRLRRRNCHGAYCVTAGCAACH
jgi:hypothetical protein